MRRLKAVTVGTFLLATACGDDDTGPERLADSFVGRVSGSDAFVAVLSDGERAAAYVCNGQGIGEWFAGDASGTTVDLLSTNQARLQATIEEGSAAGTFTPPGGAGLSFTANVATEPAGLYRSEAVVDGEEVVGGWIVLPDGEQRGAVCGPNSFGACAGAPPACIGAAFGQCSPCIQQFGVFGGQLCSPTKCLGFGVFQPNCFRQ